MELPKHNKLIDDFINEPQAMTLLFDTYKSMPQEDQEKFVAALIAHAITTHQILKQREK